LNVIRLQDAVRVHHGLRRRHARLALLAVLPLLAHCATAPRLGGIETSHALPPGTDSPLDAAAERALRVDTAARDDASAPRAPADPRGLSAVTLIESNALAYAYRASTAQQAVRSLDVQYYIWHADLTGRLLATELLRAAERGVRVRILVDDIDGRAKHDLFLVADQHPNLEVRLFNPFYSRSGILGKVTEAVLRGTRLNRRMHNKAWIADNRVAIVGGRNIGDEYFGASRHSNFADLDVLLAGPVVADVSRSFDEYWNSPNAVPVSRFEGRPPPPGALERLIADAEAWRERKAESPYVETLEEAQRQIGADVAGDASRVLAAVRLLADDPKKPDERGDGLPTSTVLRGLAPAIAAARDEILIVSPYFVPRSSGAQGLVDMVESGVRVAVLTNSLAATDVAAVHTGYARHRRDLLRGGVELYEMKQQVDGTGGHSQISVTGSSQASLHTKAMVIDRHWVYVGSMNLDPRSANINTEMGVLLESGRFAEQLRANFGRIAAPDLSYRVELEGGEGLVWYDQVDGEARRLEREPDASAGRRFTVTVLRLFPIESQL
jgi:putative cardiolipin synthase